MDRGRRRHGIVFSSLSLRLGRKSFESESVRRRFSGDQVRLFLEREKNLGPDGFPDGDSQQRAFYEIARDEVNAAAGSEPSDFVYLDCDNFKQINDHFGHQTGDLLLTVVAETLSRNIRSFDIIARLGGDEFAALLPETDTHSARGMVDRIRLQAP